MLIPKRTKYRKQHRPVRSGMSKGGNEINFGDFAIQSLAPAYVTNRQIEAARIAMTRYIKRGGRVWITIFPDRPLTKHPLGARMGSGKGAPGVLDCERAPWSRDVRNRWCVRGHR